MDKYFEFRYQMEMIGLWIGAVVLGLWVVGGIVIVIKNWRGKR